MSRIKMHQKVTGTRNGSDWPEPGGIVDVTESEAETLARQGMAEHVEPEPEPARSRETKPSPASTKREKR